MHCSNGIAGNGPGTRSISLLIHTPILTPCSPRWLHRAGLEKTGPRDKEFKLTKSGKRARFILGGDCFDKGPSNLRLLRTLGTLVKRGARLRILAGNHDIRTMLGMRNVGKKCKLENEHFFIRMGPKAVPFLKEIQTNYLQGRAALRDIPGNRKCRRRLYPSKRWFDEFVPLAGKKLSEKAVEQRNAQNRGQDSAFRGRL